jgi:hypothetical protein
MIKFIRDCLVALLFGFIALCLFAMFSSVVAHGAEGKPSPPLKRAFVFLSVAAVASNIADAEVTSWKLRSTPHFTEHDPLYGRHPSRGVILGWEGGGAAAAILLSREMRKRGHPKLALVPLALTAGSSVFWVQHNARWRYLPRGK